MINKKIQKDIYQAQIYVGRNLLISGVCVNMFDKYCPIYPVTTENIKAYYDMIDFDKKDVLTVCGSGDHAFNAIFKGANSVTTFDINKLTKYYLYLKKAAIQSLNNKEYIDFFIRGNKKALFNLDTYEIIRKNLNDDVKYFWDSLFYQKKKIRNSNLFSRDEEPKNIIISRNDYLNRINYQKLKQKIDKTNLSYYNTNLIDIPNIIKNKYDIILLSNISDYLYLMFSDDRLKKYKDFIENKLSKSLKENGIIVSSYIYDYRENKNHFTGVEIDNPKLREEIFNKNLFYTYRFDSDYEKGKKDAVMIYKKKIKSD